MGKGSGTNTVTNNSQPPQAVLDQYTHLIDQANKVAGNPLNQYGGPMIAGFTPDQLQAFSTVSNAQGISSPYISSAESMLNRSQSPLWSSAQQWSPEAINQYMNPFTNDVVNATIGNINETNAQQNQQVIGNAISKGAWGGDRAGIAQAELAREQGLASNPTIAGLRSQGFTNAQGEFNQQQGAQLAANQANNWLASQGAFAESNLGNQALQNTLQGAAAQLATGQQQQTLGQSALNIPYEQFLQQQAYPYQNLSWLSGISTGLGSGMGGTSSTTSPAPNAFSQGLGSLSSLGTLGYLGYLAFSDRRLKDDVRKIGKYKNYPLYEFRYKGDNVRNIGVMAQDVEKTNPAAVRESGGYKLVDYSKLARGGAAYGFSPHYDNGGMIPTIDLSYIPSVQLTRGVGIPNSPQPYKPPENNDASKSIGMLSAINKMKPNDNNPLNLSNGSGFTPDDLSKIAADFEAAGGGFDLGEFGLARGGFADGGMPDDDSDSGILPDDPLESSPSMGNTTSGAPSNGIAPDYMQIPDYKGGINAQPVNKVDPILSLLAAGTAIGAGTSPYFGVNAAAGAQEGIKNLQEQKKEAAEESYRQGTLQQQADRLFEQANEWRNRLFEEQQHNRATEEYQKGELGLRREEMNKNRYKVTPFGDVIDSWTGTTKQLGVQSGADPEVAQAQTMMDPLQRKAFYTQVGKQMPKDIVTNNANLLAFNKSLALLDDAIKTNQLASSGDMHIIQDFNDRNHVPIFGDPQRGDATVVFRSDVLGNALSGLKSTFGARPTNLDVQMTLKEMNAAPNMSTDQRGALLTHLRDLVAQSAQYELQAGHDIRTGKFYLPDYQVPVEGDLRKRLAPAPAAAPTAPAGIPAGSKYSPSRKQWKDPTGKLYDENGRPI